MHDCPTLRQHLRPFALALALAASLTACGSGTPSAAAAGDNAATKAGHAAAPDGNASAEQVAAEKRGDVDCPAPATPAVGGSPVDDVLGVRPGMPYTDATRTVLCSNPLLVISDETQRGFDFPTFGQTVRQGFSARFAEPRVQQTGREMAREMEHRAMERGLNVVHQDMKPSQSKWFVATMGMPGQEKVISAAREQWFDEGRNPTIASVTQSLIAKYGTPTQQLDQYRDRILRWAYDPRGRLITETSPLYKRCNGVADPDNGMNLSADCGIVVAAEIDTVHTNAALALALKVGVVDQAGGYQALADTRQGLQAMDAAHRAQQVRDADKHAQTPQL